MSDDGPVQRVRNYNYEIFANYRRGLRFSEQGRNRRRRAFQPLSGNAPIIYMPSSYDTRQIPFQLSVDGKIDLDALRQRDFRTLRNSVLNAHHDLLRLKNHILAKNGKKLFKYQRCLGWGGNGLAAAFDVIDESGNPTRSIVVKTLFDDEDESLEMEVNALKRHAKSEHIVQLVYVEGEGLISKDDKQNTQADSMKGKKRPISAVDSRDEPSSKNRRSDSSTSSSSGSSAVSSTPPPMTIILELLENGDLSNFIAKVRSHREQIPNRVLWGFLLCLVRMCIGLAYPPDSIEEYKDTPGPITETLLHGQNQEPSRIVHFDMDPRNIFIGNFTGEEHRITPILKLGDFGLALEVEDGRQDIYYEAIRRAGKRGFYAPEQFCLDWDYIPRDSNLIQDHPIAGNYRWHTNVWGLGMIMECLITLCYPLIPPTPTQSSISPPQLKARYWTYGAHLADAQYDHVDKDIRSVVLRCQANFPEDRPRLETLELFVTDRINRQYANESDEEILRWVHKILFEPPSMSPVSSSASDGPGGILGTGPDRTSVPAFFPQGIRLPPPQNLAPLQDPVAPPPRDPEQPTGIFDPADFPEARAGGFLGVGAGWGSGASSFAQPVAPNPSPTPGYAEATPRARPATIAGPIRRPKRGWAHLIHPYGRPPGSY